MALAGTMTIAIRDLVIDDSRNVRRKYRRLEELAAELAKVGQLHAVTVRRREDARYDLVCGYRRVKAAELAGWQSIEAKLWEGDELARALVNLTENLHQGELTTFEVATACWRLKKEHKLHTATIAREIGRAYTTINELIVCRDRLHPTILAAWEAEHPAATIVRLRGLQSAPWDEQLERWLEVIGISTPTSFTEPRNARENPGRPTPVEIERAINLLRRQRFESQAWHRGAITALRWVSGKRDNKLGKRLQQRTRNLFTQARKNES